MPNTLFNRYRTLAQKAEVSLGTKASMDWFRRRIRKDKPIKDHTRVSRDLKTARFELGSLCTYVYDPKTKDKLPFYDMFPLVIVLAPAKGGWYGCNLHYLPPTIRAEILLDIGYKRANLGQIAKRIENNPLTRPALKRYLQGQLQSKPVVIPRDEWEIAIQLPFENFINATQKQVWKDSRSKM